MADPSQSSAEHGDRLGPSRDADGEDFVPRRGSAKLFEFDVEEKVTCAVSGAVRYVRRRENVLPLEVPVALASNAREIEADRERKRQRRAKPRADAACGEGGEAAGQGGGGGEGGGASGGGGGAGGGGLGGGGVGGGLGGGDCGGDGGGLGGGEGGGSHLMRSSVS